MARNVIMALFLTAVFAVTSQAQPNWQIALFNDAEMSTCTVSYSAPGVIQIHVFHTGDSPSTASQFALYPPACMNGATWLGDVINPELFPGFNTQHTNGLMVAYTRCMEMPIYIGYVNFYVADTNVSCCEFPVSDPTSTEAGIDGVNCDFTDLVPVQGRSAVINPQPECPCEISLAVESTTWGKVKALYR